jgi:RNA polymerase sigma-70 factor (ECF subfamily)
LKHPDDLATVQVFMEAIRRRGTGFSYSHRIFRDDGYVRHINTAGRVSFGADGVPGLMRATVDVLGEWESPLSQVDLATASDGVLMLALRAQIPEAVAEAFRRHGAGVLRVARCFIHASLSADDIVQDVFEALLSSAGRFDARRGSLATYLKMQTRTRCIDLGRSHASRRTRELFYERADLAPPSEDVALSALAAVGVRGALEHLPPDERIPIELAYLGGICYRAVAEQLGLPEGTVKSRIRRGLLRLRESSNVL